MSTISEKLALWAYIQYMYRFLELSEAAWIDKVEFYMVLHVYFTGPARSVCFLCLGNLSVNSVEVSLLM